jgi:hypothetical protein
MCSKQTTVRSNLTITSDIRCASDTSPSPDGIDCCCTAMSATIASTNNCRRSPGTSRLCHRGVFDGVFNPLPELVSRRARALLLGRPAELAELPNECRVMQRAREAALPGGTQHRTSETCADESRRTRRCLKMQSAACSQTEGQKHSWKASSVLRGKTRT